VTLLRGDPTLIQYIEINTPLSEHTKPHMKPPLPSLAKPNSKGLPHPTASKANSLKKQKTTSCHPKNLF